MKKKLLFKNLLILPRNFIPAFNAKVQRRITYHVSRITYHVSIYYSCFINFQLGSVVVPLCICFSFLSCATKAPEDYYLHLLAMEKAGEQERRETGRKIGEIVTPEESLQPMVVLQPEQRASSLNNESLNADLIKIIDIKTNTPETEGTAESSATKAPEPKSVAMIPIGINKEVLKQSLMDKNINVIGIVTKDGRLDGGKNLIQVHFASEAMSDDAIYETFLYICAIIYGYDMDQNTVDTVMGFATVEDFPYMVLEGKMENYIDFVNRKITYREWISKLIIKKLKQ